MEFRHDVGLTKHIQMERLKYRKDSETVNMFFSCVCVCVSVRQGNIYSSHQSRHLRENKRQVLNVNALKTG